MKEQSQEIKEPRFKMITKLLADGRLIFRDKRFTFGFLIVSTLLLLTILAPYITPYPNHAEGNSGPDILAPPSWMDPEEPNNFKYLFGTTQIGRDIFTLVIFGVRTSLIVGIVVMLIGITLGVSIGMVAGYFGGLIDEVLTRFTDMFLVMPSLVLAILIAATLGPGLGSILLSLGITWWPWHARLARSQAVTFKHMSYVTAAKAMGMSDWGILIKHVIPNAVKPNIILAVSDIGSAILSAAGLSFLGLGLTQPTPDWGLLISSSRNYFPMYWWYAIFPGLALLLLVLGFMLMGDSLRELIEPKLRSLRETGV